MKDSESLAMAAAARAAEELATDIIVLDLRGLSDVVDFFVLASGTSDMHLHAVAAGIEQCLHQEGASLHHREGEVGSRWILLDYLDVIVHVMHPTTRSFYALEELWGDAPATAVESRQLTVPGSLEEGALPGDDDD